MGTVLLFVLWSLPALTASGANNPKVGDKAPPITLEKLLQASADAEANWEKLKGKVVVLEFWATWCGPCVAAIPHLNELAEKYKNKPVQFIAVTNQDEKKIKPFLARKPMRAWVGLDTDQSMHKAYQVRAIPHTVVVDANGAIAAITHPTALNEKLLDELVKRTQPVASSSKP